MDTKNQEVIDLHCDLAQMTLKYESILTRWEMQNRVINQYTEQRAHIATQLPAFGLLLNGNDIVVKK